MRAAKALTFLGVSIAVLCGGGAAYGAGYVSIGGRMVNTNINPPLAPTSRAECEEFRRENQKLESQINDAHEECLQEPGRNEGRSSSDPRACSKSHCQSLHTLLFDTRDAVSKGHSKCIAEVSSQESELRGRRSSADSDSSGLPPYDFTNFRTAMKSIASGPVDAVKKMIRNEIDHMIDRTFGLGAPYAKGALDATKTTSFLWGQTQKIRESCSSTGSTVVVRECNSELIDTIQNLPDKVPFNMRTDPGIRAIQKGLWARYALLMDGVGREFDDAAQDMKDFTPDSSPSSSSSPGSRRRSRGTPIIEN